MCRLLFGVNVRGGTIREFFEISRVLGNDDGYMFCDGNAVLRTMDLADVISFVLPDKVYSRVMAHARRASSGGVALGNVHGWFYNDWVFAHNGGVRTYISDDEVDSYVFFKALSPLLDLRDSVQIERMVRETGFYGVAYAYELTSDTLLVIATSPHYLALLPGGGYVLSSKSDVLVEIGLDPVELLPTVEFVGGMEDCGEVLTRLMGGGAGDA